MRITRPAVISFILVSLAVLVQSTLLHWVAFKGVKPDLALIILIFISIRTGSMNGQLSGFIAGLVEDIISLSPLGFHAFFRTVLGFLYGLTEGSIFVDPILIPVILVATGTLLKGLVSSLLVAIFSISAPGIAIFAGRLWIELAYNAALAPFLFAFLGLFKSLKARQKEVF